MRKNRNLIIALALATGLPLAAYVQSRNMRGGLLRRSAEDAANVEYFLNDQTAAGMTNDQGLTILAAGTDPMGGLRRAAGRWSGLPNSILNCTVVGTTSTGIDFQDGINVIHFADSPQARSITQGALAVAFPVSFDDGIIVDSDIVFNPVGMFSGEPRAFTDQIIEDGLHFPAIAVHEMGHTHGLGHSGVTGASMFARTTDASDFQEIPKDDELTFVRDIYGIPDVATNFGSIQGTISLDSGGTANGVYVAAMDPATGVTVSTLTDFTNGTFDTGPIPPGNYYVVSEPVDGPAFTFDYPGVNPSSFNTNTREVFFGGNSSPQMVNVTPGKNVAIANFSVPDGPKTLDIQRLGISPVGARQIDRITQSPLQFNPGDANDVLIWGPGIPDGITEANVMIIGDAFTVRPGSVRVDPDFTLNGMGFLRMTIDVASFRPREPAGHHRGVQRRAGLCLHGRSHRARNR